MIERNDPSILVVDDDERLRLLLLKFLREQGFLVATAQNASEAFDILEKVEFDMAIVDVMMPGKTGTELACDIRSHSDTRMAATPILMLTAMGEADDRVVGLESGVDDYLTKPFDPRELSLRIKSILRRAKPFSQTNTSEFSIGNIAYDKDKKLLSKNGVEIQLTTVEIDLLEALINAEGSPISREELAEAFPDVDNVRSIDVQITRLRKKIEDDPKFPKYLRTVRGRGYSLLSGG